ncbi:MAG: DNA cytosine methyltransferase [SAR202 cluster bacterium]|jgi:DNA (cytosine-5)-methyltransferase 1|nr:DNA cytosine methyltransferase [SAR202 cluster bacterium]
MKKYSFRFIDLFSGIGGFHFALAHLGGECVFACDIDDIANETYELNFGMKPIGDITKIHSKNIPDHEILCAGFPCQAFSNVGQKGGLRDPRGALIYEVIRILNEKKPKSFILENVKGLLSHNKGRTFNFIKNQLESIGYKIYHDILEAKDFGLPQIRKRLFIIGLRNDIKNGFNFPKKEKNLFITFSDIMRGKVEKDYAYTVRIGGRRSGINNRFNWDAYIVNGKIRYLTPEECMLLQGFPENFKLSGTLTQQYKQVGNSVPVSIVQAIGIQLIKDNII